jgi:DNA-directed RNA polymerase specialized sigma24 family protein
LSGAELVAYAIVVGRNILASEARRTRAVPGWIATDVDVDDDPAAMVLLSEERVAVREALARLPDEDRKALVAHELEGRTTI